MNSTVFEKALSAGRAVEQRLEPRRTISTSLRLASGVTMEARGEEKVEWENRERKKKEI